MAKGRSLHIGLNRVDANSYGGWDGQLTACEADANDMSAMAEGLGYETHKLLTADATSSAILEELAQAVTELEDGDIFLLTYSGHGGQVPDANSDEPDRMDETWVSYDRQIVDDELYAAFGTFATGVRIAVLSDSCHSGTVTRAVLDAVQPDAMSAALSSQNSPASLMKAMPAEVCDRDYQARKADYDRIQQQVKAFDKTEIGASVILVSGCQDNQTSADGDRNGLFTQTLREVWHDGKFKGGYRKFAKDIVAKMPPWQTPNYFMVGTPNPAFERQHPFAVKTGRTVLV
jgi:metacaspase-1